MQEKFYQEEEAFAALQKGEEKGLDFFFNRYYTPLLLFAVSLTHNRPLAQEIASEAFVKLWCNKETIPEWRKVKFLLFRIARNAAIDYLRQQKVYLRVTNELHYSGETSERSVLPKLIETETYQQLYLLLTKLPPKCREIFQMFYFQDKAIKEIAAELNISVNTVKTQKKRAIQLLRQSRAALLLEMILLFLFF